MERDLRLDPIQAIDVSLGKRFYFGSDVAIRVEGTVFNLLNADNPLSLTSLRLNEPGDEFPVSFWTQPRRLQLRLGFEF
jgi:hypothetical protein